MKLSRTTLILALALAGSSAFAQSRSSSNNVPDTMDYAGFSRFVTDRNIFDPNRQPHFSSTRTRTRTRTTSRASSSAPAFTLVGTMAYEKGWFAFFSGNSDELRRTMSTPGKIAGYTVTEILQGRAVLESADKKGKIELKVGDVMRQENGKWELSGQGEVPAGTATTTESSSAPSENSGGGASAPTSAGAPNDILKRLMEKREQETK